jgi:hypothetical protein
MHDDEETESLDSLDVNPEHLTFLLEHAPRDLWFEREAPSHESLRAGRLWTPSVDLLTVKAWDRIMRAGLPEERAERVIRVFVASRYWRPELERVRKQLDVISRSHGTDFVIVMSESRAGRLHPEAWREAQFTYLGMLEHLAVSVEREIGFAVHPGDRRSMTQVARTAKELVDS